MNSQNLEFVLALINLKMIRSSFTCAICMLAWLGSIQGVCADTVTTRNGAILQGRIVLNADGTLLVGGKRVQLADLKRAQFEVAQKPEPATKDP